MYLNRKSITKINELRTLAEKYGLTMCQTNSRLNGNHLNAIRIYESPIDKGHPDKAIYEVNDLIEINEIINSLQ